MANEEQLAIDLYYPSPDTTVRFAMCMDRFNVVFREGEGGIESRNACNTNYAKGI